MLLQVLTLPSSSCLQTKDGKGVAKGETTEEFEDIVTRVVRRTRQLQVAFPTWHAAGALYSWDNACCHRAAHLLFVEGARLEIPPCSPDIHKVIERVSHSVKASFRQTFGRKRKVTSVKKAVKPLRQVVEGCVDAESTRRDCSTIQATLQGISRMARSGLTWSCAKGVSTRA